MNPFLRQRRLVLPQKHGRKFSQLDIAVRLGWVPNTIGTYERDEVVPDLKDAAALAKAYETSEEQIEQWIVEVGRRVRSRAKKLAASRA